MMKELINKAEQHLLHTYNRYQIVWDHGEGVYLYDQNGKKYLDFVSGIGVFALGYKNAAFNDAIKAQIDQIIHTSNFFYNRPAICAAEKLTALSGLERIFFTNSGTEAVEGAIKAARKYAYEKDGTTAHEIIAMEHSFHGRTMGALAVTGNPQYREAFEPLIGQVKFARLNDLASVRACITAQTGAIILETVQGEGGIYPAEASFLKELRAICDEKDILLILDEIQCGMGRTGTLFAWQRFGVKPDIMTIAKAMGGGLPVGAFLMSERVAAHSLKAGDHGSTYGGNPLAAAAVNKVLELYESGRVMDHVNRVSPYLEAGLDRLTERFSFVTARRGVGLLQGLACRGPVNKLIERAMAHGLLLINAGADVLRFIPPLIVTEDQIDEMLVILAQCLAVEESV